MRQHSALIFLTALMLLLLSACVGQAALVFDNQTVCGTIRVDLTNTQTAEIKSYEVPVGETITVEVTPNIAYDYVVDYTAAGVNEEGYECIAIQRGQVTVPAGASQKFNLTAVTPTPPAS